MIDASRKAVQESMLTQQRKTSLDKLKSFEELLTSRVGVLKRQQKKSIEYKKKMLECDLKKAVARKDIESSKMEVQ